MLIGISILMLFLSGCKVEVDGFDQLLDEYNVSYNNDTQTINITNNITMYYDINETYYYEQNDGLVLHYTADNNAFDYSGNGNDGTISGATFAKGYYDKGFSFDGVDDYVYMSINNLTNYSISFWVKPNDIQLSGFPGILTLFGRKSDIIFRDSDNSIYLQIYDGSFHSAGLTNNLLEWTYVYISITNYNQKIYINNVLKAEKTYTPISYNSDGNYIGIASNQYFNGTIDEVRIYNRTLSQTEISNLYNYNTLIPASNFVCRLSDGTTYESPVRCKY